MENKSGLQSMLREAGILFVITLIAGLLLGVVHELTKGPIEEQHRKAVEKACSDAFPAEGAAGGLSFCQTGYELDDSFLEQLSEDGVRIGSVYRVESGLSSPEGSAEDRGWVVEAVSGEGYGGDIVLYVGVDNEGTVTGVSILELSETAGLGMEAPKVLAPQFAGKKAESFVYTKTGAAAANEVDAITSATVTTSAVVNAVNGGLHTAQYLTEHPEHLFSLEESGERGQSGE